MRMAYKNGRFANVKSYSLVIFHHGQTGMK
jgi:hypothetical protein